jgi:hypothetical protein
MSAFRQAGLLLAILVAGLAPAIAFAQDVPIGATFICNGEHIYVENCNVRDPSDNANCMVAHPDKLLPNGMNSYTYVARGALKKLLPTCTQPSAKQLNAAAAFQKRQQDIYNANEQKAVAQLNAPPTSPGGAAAPGQPAPPKNAEERAIRRCVTSGRLAASCTGNSLLGAFGQMLGSVMPGANKEPEPGPAMAGVFEGPGNWRLDFIDGGVLVNCSSLSPNQEAYTLDLKTGRATVTIKTTPRPLILAVGADSTTLTGPGPVTLDGVVAAGYASDVPSNATQKDTAGNLYDSNGNRLVGNANSGHTVFSPKTVTCPALNLSSKGASTGIQTMQTDLLKNMFGGEKGAPTPPGIRMHGIFASAATGFSVQFFPESVILGCGPDAARAYPYMVVAGGAAAYIRIDAPDHPLRLAFRPDGSLDPGSTGPYQVHGRYATGQDQNDDFTFAPMEQSCSLAALAPSHEIPTTGGGSQAASAIPTATAAMSTSAAMSRTGAVPPAAPTPTTAARPDATASNNAGTLSTPAAPLGNATLSIASGLAPQPGAPSPLAGRPYIILRDSYAHTLARAGVMVPAGTSPYKFAGMACGTRTADCPKINDAIKAAAISAARADMSGAAALPGVPPGTYYLMISARIGTQSFVWDGPVQLKPGANSLRLDQRNASPIE